MRMLASRLLLAGMLCLFATTPAISCPNCKDALSRQEHLEGPGSGAGAGDFATGFSRSVLLMMAMPFALLGVGTVAVVRLARRGGIPQL